jgi:hypothetical protein
VDGVGSTAGGGGAAVPCPVWKALTSLLVISGLTTDSPAIVRWMAEASISLSIVLSR